MNTFLTKLTITILIATTSSKTLCTLEFFRSLFPSSVTTLQNKVNKANQKVNDAATALKTHLTNVGKTIKPVYNTDSSRDRVDNIISAANEHINPTKTTLKSDTGDISINTPEAKAKTSELLTNYLKAVTQANKAETAAIVAARKNKAAQNKGGGTQQTRIETHSESAV